MTYSLVWTRRATRNELRTGWSVFVRATVVRGGGRAVCVLGTATRGFAPHLPSDGDGIAGLGASSDPLRVGVAKPAAGSATSLGPSYPFGIANDLKI
jgi:hypothetical protein